MYQKIFVPVDGSEPSNNGLMEAIKLAKCQNAKLKLLYVMNEDVLYTDYAIGTYVGEATDLSRQEGTNILHSAAALVRQFALDPETVAVESFGGKIAPMIIAQATEWAADLIVMGTHGRRGLKRLAMGSVAEEVVRQVRIPVLLVHDGSKTTPEAQVKGRDTVASIRPVHA